MLLSKEYVGYLARQIAQKLMAGQFIEAKDTAVVSQALNVALLEEYDFSAKITYHTHIIYEI